MNEEIPIIAIVGRQNVGKSTLFNRISGSHNVAIVDSTPGVTRDRNYIECTWGEKNFMLVDTGGLDTINKSQDVFMPNIYKQVEKAIQEACLILFVVDINEGITSLEKNIAEKLRKSGKNVILVINKIDYKENYNIYEFRGLGFNNMIEVSASHGINIGDLLDKIISNLTIPSSNIESDSFIKVAIVGKPNVGKSSLTNYILGEERSIVSEFPGTTRDSIHSYFKYKDNTFMLVDTAGIRKHAKIHDNVEFYSVNRTFKAIEKSDIVLLILDASSEITEQDEKIAGFIEECGKACLLVVNKWDLAEHGENAVKLFKEKIFVRMPFMEYAPVFFISAVTGLKITKLLDNIPEIYSLWAGRIKTSHLNKFFSNIQNEKRPVFSKKGGNNKLMYITQDRIKPPTFAIYFKGAGQLHDSYMRYIKNKLRINFPLTGVPIRLKIKRITSKNTDRRVNTSEN
ncbi:ribosome biogenesis GTPase Der [Candidatus Desantisbacteria bacterium]|nr:ribosome biogenesis GTPase Der [Candidatus Desantisbacteria bacterium]